MCYYESLVTLAIDPACSVTEVPVSDAKFIVKPPIPLNVTINFIPIECCVAVAETPVVTRVESNVPVVATCSVSRFAELVVVALLKPYKNPLAKVHVPVDLTILNLHPVVVAVLVKLPSKVIKYVPALGIGILVMLLIDSGDVVVAVTAPPTATVVSFSKVPLLDRYCSLSVPKVVVAWFITVPSTKTNLSPLAIVAGELAHVPFDRSVLWACDAVAAPISDNSCAGVLVTIACAVDAGFAVNTGI